MNRDDRRSALLDRMADHLLAHGLEGASLRPLARAAGTSDRMLLYYFADKDELLGAVLDHIAARMAALLGSSAPTTKPYRELLTEIAAAVRTPALRPYMHLWLELAAAAARGREPHRAIAGRIADGFLAWVEARLEPGSGGRAASLLALVDGVALLDAVDRSEAADRALRAEGGANE